MAFFRKRDTWTTENTDVKTWSLVQGDTWKIILYVNAWKSNLLLNMKTNQSPYSDASLRRNLICSLIKIWPLTCSCLLICHACEVWETPLGFTCRWPKVVTLADQSNSYFRSYESNRDMQCRISGSEINIHGSFRIYRKISHKQTWGNSVKQLKKRYANLIDYKSEKCRFLNEHRNTWQYCEIYVS